MKPEGPLWKGYNGQLGRGIEGPESRGQEGQGRGAQMLTKTNLRKIIIIIIINICKCK